MMKPEVSVLSGLGLVPDSDGRTNRQTELPYRPIANTQLSRVKTDHAMSLC